MTMPAIIDSHCHIDFDVFDNDRDDVLQHAKDNGVNELIIPGVVRKDWSKIQTLIRALSEISDF